MEKFEISKHSTLGAYNGFRYVVYQNKSIRKSVEVDSNKHITIAFDGKINKPDPEKLMTIAKAILNELAQDYVLIADTSENKDEIIVIKKPESNSPPSS